MRDARPLSEQAITLLKKRYLKPGEDWAALCRRVAKFAANNPEEEEQFYHLLYTRVLLPNTPCMVNAGTKDPQVSACFLLPIEDSLDSIFKTLANAAKIYQSAGGVGINFSPLRPAGFPLSRGGVSSGPISFLRIFNEMTEQVKQGSMRRGAGMALLQIDHPDIVKFIKCKNTEGTLANFNISVMVTYEFMRLLKTTQNSTWLTKFNGREYWIERNRADPTQDGTWWDTSEIPLEHSATPYTVQDIWDLICEQAWKNGEPGLIFIDTARENDPGVDGCNPCQPGFATVLTPDGIRIFDDIDVGSTIWSGRQWTKVVRKVHTGIKPVYGIEAYDTRTKNINDIKYLRQEPLTLYATMNHQVVSKGKKVQLKDAKCIDIAPEPEENKETITTIDISVIRYIGDHHVYDITVDAPEHTYWTGGLLVSNCGEVIMEPYEACVLASIDVSRFVPENTTGYDFKGLEDVAAVGCLFLNRLVDKGKFPLPEIAEKVRTNRRIGLGIMGLADTFLLRQMRYGDEESLQFATEIATTITTVAATLSALAGFNNRTVACIAPTGSISQIAGCSSGCEPIYDWVTKQTRVDFGVQEVTHPLAAQYKSLQNLPPYFVTALQVTPDEHVLMQAALQGQIDGSISKTINLPHDATIDDVDLAYDTAYDMRCKGITIYRDKSREVQVLSQATPTTTLPTCKEQPELSEEEELLDEDGLVEGDDNYWEAFLSELGLPHERPYCLEGFTFKLKLDMGGKLENTYVTVTTIDNRPYEIFVYGNVRDADQIIAQYIDTVSRLISLSLRSGVPLDTVVTQLRKVPCSHIFSIPHKLADILQEFQADTPVEYKYVPEGKPASQVGPKHEVCPECHGLHCLTRSEGCLKCTDCGWSKCG